MDRHRIRCVQKSMDLSFHNRIEFIGGLNANGTKWKVSHERAIAGIENGKWQFFIEIEGKIIDIIIANHNGIKYLKSESDYLEPTNMLRLPDCL